MPPIIDSGLPGYQLKAISALSVIANEIRLRLITPVKADRIWGFWLAYSSKGTNWINLPLGMLRKMTFTPMGL